MRMELVRALEVCEGFVEAAHIVEGLTLLELGPGLLDLGVGLGPQRSSHQLQRQAEEQRGAKNGKLEASDEGAWGSPSWREPGLEVERTLASRVLAGRARGGKWRDVGHRR
jgi:hypothetical protein